MGVFKQHTLIIPNFWGLEVLQSRCQQHSALTKAFGESLFQAFALASGVASNAWHSLAYRCIAPICILLAHDILSVCLCVPSLPVIMN